MSGRGLDEEQGQSALGNSTWSTLERFTSSPAFPGSGRDAGPGGPPAAHPASCPSQGLRAAPARLLSPAPALPGCAPRPAGAARPKRSSRISQLRSPAPRAAVDSPLMRIEFLLNSAHGSRRKRGDGAARSS